MAQVHSPCNFKRSNYGVEMTVKYYVIHHEDYASPDTYVFFTKEEVKDWLKKNYVKGNWRAVDIVEYTRFIEPEELLSEV